MSLLKRRREKRQVHARTRTKRAEHRARKRRSKRRNQTTVFEHGTGPEKIMLNSRTTIPPLSTKMASVTLPKRENETNERPPIWSIERSESTRDASTPLNALCDQHNRVQCCRDLKGE